jgi:hypothetical protein
MFKEECPVVAETKGTPDNSQPVLGYDAYFGTYTLNENEGIVTHQGVADEMRIYGRCPREPLCPAFINPKQEQNGTIPRGPLIGCE